MDLAMFPVCLDGLVASGLSCLPDQQLLGESKMDFTALATAVQTAITGALTAVVPLVGVLISASVGYKLFRKFTG